MQYRVIRMYKKTKIYIFNIINNYIVNGCVILYLYIIHICMITIIIIILKVQYFIFLCSVASNFFLNQILYKNIYIKKNKDKYILVCYV